MAGSNPSSAPQPAFFAVQVADTKAAGGLETLVYNYSSMFRQNNVPSVCIYRGPASDLLRSHNVELLPMPWVLTSPVGQHFARASTFRRQLLERAGGARLLFIVHSDRTLSTLRSMFPDAVIAASCHSDKVKRKGVADLLITGNDPQQKFVSESVAGTRARAVKLGNPYALETQPIGVDVGKIGRRIIFCARFTAIKSPMTVLDAIEHLKPEGLPEFVFIGDGPQAGDLHKAAAAKPAVITFPGWKQKPWDEFQPGDILVLPSSFEGLPYLLLEALDREVPVIASDIPGNREALGGGQFGLLFPVGDAKALAACIDRARSDPASMAAMAKAGRKSIADRFGSQNFWKAMQIAIGRP